MLAEWAVRREQMPEEASSAACVAPGADSAAQLCRGRLQTLKLPLPLLPDPAIHCLNHCKINNETPASVSGDAERHPSGFRV